MVLIGSTSRVVAGGKAVKTVYWRASQKKGAEASKIVKTGKTLNYGQPNPDLNRTAVTSPIRGTSL
uniref:Unkown protein n=1 Tax=Riptortus pedestris TaxID=329032 RepID=R4WCV7_RIPPE|nr:unkown protein [Riptortus pedestris]